MNGPASRRSGKLARAATGFAVQSGDVHMLETILLIVVILLLIGALPAWPHSRSWGYYPSGGIGLILLIIIIILLIGRV
jgi:hypothetical protein